MRDDDDLGAAIRQRRILAIRALVVLVATLAFYALLPIVEAAAADALGAGSARVVLAWMRGLSIMIIMVEAAFAVGCAAAATVLERQQAARRRGS
jgi:hypothetical protein